MGKTILAAGDAAMDVLLNIPYVPNGGRTAVSAGRYSFTPGGSGAYTAVAARRSGGDVALCARVGDDEQGRRLLGFLKEEEVGTVYVATDPVNQTALNIYLLESYGAGGLVRYKGAAAMLSCADLERAFGCYPDLFTTSLKLGAEVLRYAARLTRSQSIPFVLDASGASGVCRPEDLRGVDILISGEGETELLTGIRPNNTDNCLRACIALCDRMPLSFVVLKLGRRGAYIYDGKYCELLMAPELEDVDSTAEHESFVGAFCSRFAREFDVYAAAVYGLAASALAASRVGGFASIPNEGDINNIL